VTVLYIGAANRRAGKTAFALALARRLLGEGVAVGYWKPLSAAGPADPDVAFAGQVLRLAGVTAPIARQGESGETPADWQRRLAESFAAVAKGNDILLVEGSDDLDGAAGGPLAADILALLTARAGALGPVKALCLARYRDGDLLGQIAAASAAFGNAGAVVNVVPEVHRWFVDQQVAPALAAQAIALFGVLPQDPALAAMTVRELAAYLGARVLVNEHEPAMDELFESIMFGSMSAEDAQAYFSRKQNKLVVTRGDHPDVHLAALDTSTRCLLLCGGYPSYPFVLDRAEELGVPVLSVGAGMKETIARLDDLLEHALTSSVAKVERFERLLADRLDWAAVYRMLGLPARQAQ
jgi:BioD-like phosphotransacetylase family protein